VKVNPDGTQARNEKGQLEYVNLVRFHDARRTNRTLLQDAGVQQVDSMATMGHKSSRQHDDYAHSKLAAVRIHDLLETLVFSRDEEAKPEAGKIDKPVQQIESCVVDLASQLDRFHAMLKEGQLDPDQHRKAIYKLLS